MMADNEKCAKIAEKANALLSRWKEPPMCFYKYEYSTYRFFELKKADITVLAFPDDFITDKDNPMDEYFLLAVVMMRFIDPLNFNGMRAAYILGIYLRELKEND